MSEVEMVVNSILVNPIGNPWETPRIIVLKEKLGNQYLSIQVEPKEADAINIILNGISLPEPQTYDFVLAIIDSLGASVKSIIIYKFVELFFWAKVILVLHGKHYEVDCRSSDAIALALRVNIPILVDKQLLRKFAYT